MTNFRAKWLKNHTLRCCTNRPFIAYQMEASLALGFTVQDTAHCSQRDPVGSGIMTLSRLITKADNGDD